MGKGKRNRLKRIGEVAYYESDVCDFCDEAEVVWAFPTRTFKTRMEVVHEDGVSILRSTVSGRWITCARCGQLVLDHDWNTLIREAVARRLKQHPPEESPDPDWAQHTLESLQLFYTKLQGHMYGDPHRLTQEEKQAKKANRRPPFSAMDMWFGRPGGSKFKSVRHD